MNPDQDYNQKLKAKLDDFLKRPATLNDQINAENDTDLTLQVIWEMFVELETRVAVLEKGIKVV